MLKLQAAMSAKIGITGKGHSREMSKVNTFCSKTATQGGGECVSQSQGQGGQSGTKVDQIHTKWDKVISAFWLAVPKTNVSI